LSWIILVLSGILEAVWATALGKSDGFTKLWPSVVFGVALVASMGGLAWAMRDIPTGTAYAVWVGIGAVGAAVFGITVRHEPVSAARLAFLGLLVIAVVGLKAVSAH
jgi:quaternary ammonium compound-resistance protein SugE